MGTRRIDRKEIEGLPVLAEGYKIFNDDWTCMDYCYADENGNVEGSVHKADGEIKAGENGLHFCSEMLEYIRNMAEYDDDIFNKITGGAFKED